MLLAGGLFEARKEAVEVLDNALRSGLAAERFESMVSALGGPDNLLERFGELAADRGVEDIEAAVRATQ